MTLTFDIHIGSCTHLVNYIYHPIAQLVECPLRGTGGHGFDPGPRHTKAVKNGTSCSSLGTQTRGRARTGRPSVRIM